MLAFAAFMVAGAALNWLAGGNRRWRKRLGLPGRSIYYAALIALAVLWPLYGGEGALAVLSILTWRLPGWYGALDAGLDPLANRGQGQIFGRDVRPLRVRDFVVMSARGLLMFPLFTVEAWRAQSLAPIAILAVCALAQGVAYEIGHRALSRRNDVAEALTGAVWGAAFCVVLAG